VILTLALVPSEVTGTAATGCSQVYKRDWQSKVWDNHLQTSTLATLDLGWFISLCSPSSHEFRRKHPNPNVNKTDSSNCYVVQYYWMVSVRLHDSLWIVDVINFRITRDEKSEMASSFRNAFDLSNLPKTWLGKPSAGRNQMRRRSLSGRRDSRQIFLCRSTSWSSKTNTLSRVSKGLFNSDSIDCTRLFHTHDSVYETGKRAVWPASPLILVSDSSTLYVFWILRVESLAWT